MRTPPPASGDSNNGNDPDSLGPGLFEALRARYPNPHDRGKVFERLMQFAFRRHPDVWGPQRFKTVWRWMEWPERAARGYGHDIGIDLVAEQTDAWGGGLCAIQTKFHDTASIDMPAVASFLSASSTDWCTSRVLVVTSRLNENAMTVVSNASPRCEVLFGPDIESWPIDWSGFIASLPSNLPEIIDAFELPDDFFFRPEPYEPWPFQAKAVHKVVTGFETEDRGKLVLPCGTGKSVVALWIAERMAGRGGRVIYLVPSIALMGQTMRE